MTDVRLTATNPADSSVVPVACNEKGELKLEEPIVSPPFDGNLDGDLNVNGSASFAGPVTVNQSDNWSFLVGDQSSGQATFGVYPRTTDTTVVLGAYRAADTLVLTTGGNDSVSIAPDGSAKFASGDVEITADGKMSLGDWSGSAGVNIAPSGYVHVRKDGGSTAIGVWNGPGDTPTATINVDGSIQSGGFPKTVTRERGVGLSPDGYIQASNSDTDGPLFLGYKAGTQNRVIGFTNEGAATFEGEVTVGSKGSKWLIRESNGVAMLIEQTRRGAKEPRGLEDVRDLPRELDLVEAALNEIMGKLKMTPPAGWPVWDGSDNSQ